MAISKKGITLFYAEKGAANIENTTFAAREPYSDLMYGD